MKLRSTLQTKRLSIASLAAALLLPCAQAADWPTWGGDGTRNMVSLEKGVTLDFDPGRMDEDEKVDMKTTKNVKWIAKLGSQAYGNVTIADGRVYVGTNNESPRDSDKKGDRGIVMCFDEKTGALNWQLVIPKLGAGKVSDWEYIGVCSSPAIEGNRAYVVTNKCEVVCLDVEGLKNGNEGPFKDEAKYVNPKGKSAPLKKDLDADIIWKYDMRDELGVFPHNVTSSSAVIVGDVLFVATSNGVDWSHTNIPSPLSPCWIALNKKTGELVGEDGSGAGKNAMHAAWSSLTYGKAGGKEVLVWGGTDGFCYGYSSKPVKDEEGFDVFKPLWQVDCNEPHYRVDKKGKKIPYATPPGPSELIGTPVLYEGKVYAAIGQDPEHGDGVGRLTCIDAVTGKVLWKYTDVGRTISTASVADDLVYIAEYAGLIHCLDANTGKLHWKHDTFSRIWGSTLVAGGKVLLGNEDGDLIILDHGKDKPKLLWKAKGIGAGFSSVSVTGGRIYTMGDGQEASQVHCLNPRTGKILWSSKPVGKTGGNYKGTRCTPTFDDGHLYALGQFGDLVCLRANDGSEVWRKSLTKDFGGRSGGWNYTESPLVDQGKVMVTPGGKQGAVAALDKKTGELVWQSKEFTDGAQYSSLIVRDFGGKRQYIQLTGANVVGLEASTGKVLWKAPRKGRTATISTPIFHEGHLFVSSAYGVGCNGFKVTHAGGRFSAKEIYANKTISNHHGGCIRVGDYVYASSSGTLACMELKTGKEMWRQRSAGKGSVLVIDGKIILRAESGPLALVELNPNEYRQISKFDQPDRSKAKAWPHPVVSDGVLYVRDQDILLAYDVRK